MSLDTIKIASAARTLRLSLSDDEAARFLEFLAPSFAAMDDLDRAFERVRGKPLSRQWRRPSPAEDPFNAWAVRTDLCEAQNGLLAGRTLAVKDNIMLSGVPLSNGSATLDGYVADADATVVTRVLAAGATILGKANCECFCMGCGSDTSFNGPVLNPLDQRRTAGGSSSGCAALVASGAVDMAIGGDQGGSIRMPSSFCGIVGLKPTRGLVPYTGVLPIDPLLDHVGPMSRTVADNALLLRAIAGPDGLDPRQWGGSLVLQPDRGISPDVSGLRIGMLREGFGGDYAEDVVDDAVRTAATRFEAGGARVTEVSIPSHTSAPILWAAIGGHAISQTVMRGDLFGYGRDDLFSVSAMEFHRRAGDRLDRLSTLIKLFAVFGEINAANKGAIPYAKAATLARRMRQEHLDVFQEVDILIMPTTPMRAYSASVGSTDSVESYQHMVAAARNTMTANLTGLPALATPCGLADGMPISMMLTGPAWSEHVLYVAADWYEQAYGLHCKPHQV